MVLRKIPSRNGLLPILILSLVSVAGALVQTSLTRQRRTNNTATLPPAVMYIDPNTSPLCRRMRATSLNDAWCDVTAIKGPTYSPVKSGMLPMHDVSRTVHYVGAQQLYLAVTCDHTYLLRCYLYQYMPNPRCHPTMTMFQSKAPVFTGGIFYKLKLISFETQFLEAAAREFDASELFADKVIIRKNYKATISHSIIGRGSFHLNSSMAMNNVSIGLVLEGGLLMGTVRHKSEYVITNTHFGEIESAGVQISMFGNLSMTNVTIGKLQVNAFTFGQGSSVSLTNVVISQASYGAIVMSEMARLVYYNVTVAGKQMRKDSDIIRLDRKVGSMSIEINEESTFCKQREGHYLCDLAAVKERLDISWSRNNTFGSITLLNAPMASVMFQCIPQLTMTNMTGDVYDLTQRTCRNSPNITIENSRINAFHLEEANFVNITGSSFESLMLERVNSSTFSDVTIDTIDRIVLEADGSGVTFWDSIRVNTAIILDISTPITITNSVFNNTESLVLDHPGQQSRLLNSTFRAIPSEGVRVVRGELVLDNVVVKMDLSQQTSFFVEEGGNITIGKVAILYDPLIRFGYYSLISVNTLDQLVSLPHGDRTFINPILEVRSDRVTPPSARYVVDYALSYCSSPINFIKNLRCNFTGVANSSVFVGHMRRQKTEQLVVIGADSVTLSDTCVNQLSVINVGKLTVDKFIHCPMELIIENTVVDRIFSDINVLSAFNMTMADLIIKNVPFRVDLAYSSIPLADVKANAITITGTSIRQLNITVLYKASLNDNNITAIGGFYIYGNGDCSINNTVIDSIKNGSIVNYGRLIISNSLIKNAPNGTIKLLKNSNTLFQNVVFENFTNAILYDEGAQLSMINVTVNGGENLQTIKRFSVVPANDAIASLNKTVSILITLKVPSPVSNISEQTSSTAFTTPYQNTVSPAPSNPAKSAPEGVSEDADNVSQKHNEVNHGTVTDSITAAGNDDSASTNSSIASGYFEDSFDLNDTFVESQTEAALMGDGIKHAVFEDVHVNHPKVLPSNPAAHTSVKSEYLSSGVIASIIVGVLLVTGLVAAAIAIAKKRHLLPGVSMLPSAYFTGTSNTERIVDDDVMDAEHQQHQQNQHQPAQQEGAQSVNNFSLVFLGLSSNNQ